MKKLHLLLSVLLISFCTLSFAGSDYLGDQVKAPTQIETTTVEDAVYNNGNGVLLAYAGEGDTQTDMVSRKADFMGSESLSDSLGVVIDIMLDPAIKDLLLNAQTVIQAMPGPGATVDSWFSWINLVVLGLGAIVTYFLAKFNKLKGVQGTET